MKTTDITSIEKLASKLIEAGPAYIAVDRDDYEITKGRFGAPSIAIGTGSCRSASSLISTLKQEISEEDISNAKALMLFLTTSRDNGMTMGELQQIDALISNGIPSDVRFLRGISFDQEEGNHSATLILWK